MRADRLARSLALASRASVSTNSRWTCRACSAQIHIPTIKLPKSIRSITTKPRAVAEKIAPGLQGLSDDNVEASSTKPTLIRQSTNAETRAMQRLDILLEDSQAILGSDTVPKEGEILEALKTCQGLANYFKAIKDKPALSTIRPGGEVGNLLFLDVKEGKSEHPEFSPTVLGSMASSIADEAMDRISEAVNRIAEDENVFMTPTVLQQAVDILSLLERPESLARMFILYANKSIPEPGTNPVRYKSANPRNITSAIPLPVAQTALNAAIKAENLPLCLDIVEHTVRTTAYKRAKIARKALLPGTAAVLTPFAAYAAARQLAELQDAMSTGQMAVVGTLGIMTYIGCTGTIGFVAATTANDQMKRITWASGMHLKQRWLREDERAMMDQIACAWGFQDPNRRGEEEGSDWQALKELCGIRGMVLDRVELMEGMQ